MGMIFFMPFRFLSQNYGIHGRTTNCRVVHRLGIRKFRTHRLYSPNRVSLWCPTVNNVRSKNTYMIVVFKHFFRKNYVGLTLWPFIIVREDVHKEDAVLINHERIHLKQQLELLILPFYLWYFAEWSLRTLWYLDSYRAYQNISFEREAYANERDFDYPKDRKPYSFLNYLFRA